MVVSRNSEAAHPSLRYRGASIGYQVCGFLSGAALHKSDFFDFCAPCGGAHDGRCNLFRLHPPIHGITRQRESIAKSDQARAISPISISNTRDRLFFPAPLRYFVILREIAHRCSLSLSYDML